LRFAQTPRWDPQARLLPATRTSICQGRS
jgi:hypothetical protein